MTKSPALPAPIFEYGQPVEVSKLPDPVVAKVPEYTQWGPHDTVRLEATTSAGNAWSDVIQLSPGTQFPLSFAIPKSLFEKGLVADATATLAYVVWAGGVNPSHSQLLTLSLKP